MKGDLIEKFKKLNKFRNIFVPIGFVCIGAMYIAYFVLKSNGYEHAQEVLFAAFMVTVVVLMIIYALSTIAKNQAGYILFMRKKAEKEAKEAEEKAAQIKKEEKEKRRQQKKSTRRNHSENSKDNFEKSEKE